jgi:hypothetical protein
LRAVEAAPGRSESLLTKPSHSAASDREAENFTQLAAFKPVRNGDPLLFSPSSGAAGKPGGLEALGF